MVRGFLYAIMLLGGLLAAGATGDLVSAGRYDLLFGPSELAQSVFSLGDMVDDKMALKSALAREYGVANTAAVIRLLSDHYDVANPVVIPTPDFNSYYPEQKSNAIHPHPSPPPSRGREHKERILSRL
jgi:hypothetical protein